MVRREVRCRKGARKMENDTRCILKSSTLHNHFFWNNPSLPPIFDTFITSRYVRLVRVFRMLQPPAKSSGERSSSQFAIVLPESSTSSVISSIPCKNSVYRADVVMSKLRGSCNILHTGLGSRLPSSLDL